MKLTPLFLLLLITQEAFSQIKVDLLVYNANVYTVDRLFSKVEAFAVEKGKIIALGKSADLQKKYDAIEKINAEGHFILPGFIDAHTHFVNYGIGLQSLNLIGTTSWAEVISKLQTYAKQHKEDWLIGRGWDQNDWTIKEFPDNEKLNELFPLQPVMLKRVDGHAVIVNNKALELAGIRAGDKIAGGVIEVKKGKVTGILIDNAVGLVSAKIPPPTMSEIKDGLLKGQRNCFAAGLTSVDDCGLSYKDVLMIGGLQKTGELKMRIYAMLSDEKANYDFLFATGKIKTDRLNVRAFKVYADGALGSRGACLLEPYLDKPGWTGFLRSSRQHFDSVATIIAQHGLQMCTHAIGDSANRLMLNIYATHLKGKNDMRWRIEHAQVINKNDFHLFGDFNIIPSVQPTHATSDMYWAGERLGKIRLKNAYAYHLLLNENGWIPLGTDFPVEDISPLKTFYAAVARKDVSGWPEKSFQAENALSREEALRGITIWAAKSNFEEEEKGSIEVGKFADFIIVDRNLMAIPEKEILNTTILMTCINGQKVYTQK